MINTFISPAEDREVQGFLQEAGAVADKYREAVIASDADFLEAGEMIKRIRETKKRADELRKRFTAPVDALKKVYQGYFMPSIDALDAADRALSAKVVAYKAEVDRRAAQAAEAARLEAEKAEREERARLEREAKKAAKDGDAGLAADLRRKKDEVVVEAKPVEVAPPKIAGLNFREVWRARVIDLKKIPVAYIEANISALEKVGQATKGMANIPGVEFYVEQEARRTR